MTFTQLCNKTYFLTNTNSASYPIADLTQSINNGLEKVVSIIMQSDGRWQWDDQNQTDLPIGTTSLVSDQQDYAITITHLRITRVELKDQDGNWRELVPIDQADVYDQSLTDFLKTSGTPVYYDKIGNSLFLYPKPDYSQAASLKVYFQRGPVLFDTSDTTDVPGFNSLYHELLAYYAAKDFYLAKKDAAGVQMVTPEIMVWEQRLVEDYAMRSKDEHIRLQARPYNFS